MCYRSDPDLRRRTECPRRKLPEFERHGSGHAFPPKLRPAQRYFDMVAKETTATLRQNAIPGVAADFSGIENTVKTNQKDLAGAHCRRAASLRAEAEAPHLPRMRNFSAEFSERVGRLPLVPPFTSTICLPESTQCSFWTPAPPKAQPPCPSFCSRWATDWKLGGLYTKSSSSGATTATGSPPALGTTKQRGNRTTHGSTLDGSQLISLFLS